MSVRKIKHSRPTLKEAPEAGTRTRVEPLQRILIWMFGM